MTSSSRLRSLAFSLALGGALISATCAGRLAAAESDRPNVILVITDDQGYGDLACHGNTVLQTPNLDRLHAESVRLTDFHVSPCRTPTRAGLMTGRNPLRVGAWGTTWGRSLPRADATTMAEVFQRSGYRTGCFGKWHLGDKLAPTGSWTVRGEAGSGAVAARRTIPL